MTAFNIESYKWLQQQPDDTHTAILSQISIQLNSFTVNANFVNSTAPAVPQVVAPFKASGFAVRLNTLWFSSLVCSLLSASLGLLVKQWLREYLAGSSNISRESIRIRQYRYDGMRRWRVPEIILCLPILLQAALLLFFIGLLDLLWTLHPIVAGVVTTIVAVSMLFAITTSLLPPFYPDCPYKSPQSWLICAFTQWVKRSAVALAARYHAHLHQPRASGVLTDRERAHGAATPDPFATMLDLPAIIAHSRLGAALRGWLHRLSLARAYGSWKEREKLAMEAGRAAAALDDATLAGADAMFMDDAFLHAVVRPCMRDIAPHAALRCVDRILLRRAPRVLNDMPYWDLAPPGEGGRGDTGTLTLMNLLLDVLHRLNSGRESDAIVEEWEERDGPAETKEDARRGVLMTMHRLVRAIPAPTESKTGTTENRTDAQTRPLFRRMFEVLAGVLDAEAGRASPERFVRERSFNLMCKMFTRFQAVGPDCKRPDVSVRFSGWLISTVHQVSQRSVLTASRHAKRTRHTVSCRHVTWSSVLPQCLRVPPVDQGPLQGSNNPARVTRLPLPAHIPWGPVTSGLSTPPSPVLSPCTQSLSKCWRPRTPMTLTRTPMTPPRTPQMTTHPSAQRCSTFCTTSSASSLCPSLAQRNTARQWRC